jgi:hypothetical protein
MCSGGEACGAQTTSPLSCGPLLQEECMPVLVETERSTVGPCVWGVVVVGGG